MSELRLPDNMEEADTRIGELKEGVASIQDQLSKRKRPKSYNVEEVKSFDVWRRRAIDAMHYKQAELYALKSWKKIFYRERGKRLGEDIGTSGMLYRLQRIVKRAMGTALEITPQEQEHVDTVQAYLRSVDETGELNDGGSSRNKAAQEDEAGTEHALVSSEGSASSATTHQ